MEVERVVVAPERPAVGQTRAARPARPDRQPVERGSRTHDQGRRDQLHRSRGTAARTGFPPGRRRLDVGACRDRGRSLRHRAIRHARRGRPRDIRPIGRPGDRRRSIGSNAARRIRTCNQGIQGPSRFHEAWTISSSSSRTPPPTSGRMLASRNGDASRRGGRALAAGIIVGTHPASL